jgi:hypothetical protein
VLSSSRVLEDGGGFATITNAGTVETRVGLSSEVGSIVSEANTVLDSRARVHGSVTLAAPAQLFRGVQVTVDGTVTGDDHRPSQLLGRGRSRQLRAADRRGASQGGGARPGSRRGVPGRAAGATC